MLPSSLIRLPLFQLSGFSVSVILNINVNIVQPSGDYYWRAASDKAATPLTVVVYAHYFFLRTSVDCVWPRPGLLTSRLAKYSTKPVPLPGYLGPRVPGVGTCM